MIFVGSGFGDDVDDAALRLAVLRFEPAGLYLHFLDVGSVDSHAQCAVDTAKDPRPPKEASVMLTPSAI